MNFSPIPLDADAQAFWGEAREWLDEHVTPELIDAEWRSGDGHNPDLHQALGKKGWVFPRLPVEEGGAGLGPLEARILEHELVAHQAPTTTRDITALVMFALRRWMREPLRTELLLMAARGETCFCLGYTEPEAGSDLASVRTRAELDGDEWTINGQKIFTTGAQHGGYSLLLARTDPAAPKHKGLTMFLVPLDSPGVQIQKIETLGGERTNIVFYDQVRLDDAYRLGAPGQGWAVLHTPLNVEHRMSEDGPTPVEEEEGEAGMVSADIASRAVRVNESVLRSVVAWAEDPAANGQRPIDDPLVRDRLAEAELALVLTRVTPGPHGRVAAAECLIRNASDLLDLVGPGGLPVRSEPGAVTNGWAEYAHRFAQGTAIYGGTTDVFRNLIAQHFLGLTGRQRTGESS